MLSACVIFRLFWLLDDLWSLVFDLRMFGLVFLLLDDFWLFGTSFLLSFGCMADDPRGSFGWFGSTRASRDPRGLGWDPRFLWCNIDPGLTW